MDSLFCHTYMELVWYRRLFFAHVAAGDDIDTQP